MRSCERTIERRSGGDASLFRACSAQSSEWRCGAVALTLVLEMGGPSRLASHWSPGPFGQPVRPAPTKGGSSDPLVRRQNAQPEPRGVVIARRDDVPAWWGALSGPLGAAVNRIASSGIVGDRRLR